MRLTRLRTLHFIASLLAAPAAFSASFEVNPIRLDVSAASRTTSVTLRNTSTDPVVVQTSVMSWSQADGRDQYAPTKEVLVTPPIVTIPPGGEQIVRAGLRRSPDPALELAYRVYFQEAPPPPKPGFQGLQVALRIGLPLFVQPTQGPARANLTWRAQRTSDKTMRLELHNGGNGHIQIAEVQLLPVGSDKPLATQSGLAYVLPGQQRAWDLTVVEADATRSAERARLKAATDMGSVDMEIAITNR